MSEIPSEDAQERLDLQDQLKSDLEDFFVDQMGTHLERVASNHWPLLISKYVSAIGLGLVALSITLLLLTFKLVPSAEIIATSKFLTPVVTNPLGLILSQGFSGLMFFLILGIIDKQMTSNIVFLGHMEALYSTILTEGEDRFMARVERIFRRIDAGDGTTFTTSLLSEGLKVQSGSEAVFYNFRGDVASGFTKFLTWGFLVSGSLLLSDVLRIVFEVSKTLGAWFF